MIRVTVSEDQVLELVWRTAKPADRPEDGCLLTRVTGVDQRQPVVALDQEGVCHPHGYDMHTFDHALHSHKWNSKQCLHWRILPYKLPECVSHFYVESEVLIKPTPSVITE